jgi:hypothetical protein
MTSREMRSCQRITAHRYKSIQLCMPFAVLHLVLLQVLEEFAIEKVTQGVCYLL